MVKPKEEKNEPEDVIMERMNEALKKMMSTPPETQKEMIERRRRQGGRLRPDKGSGNKSS